MEIPHAKPRAFVVSVDNVSTDLFLPLILFRVMAFFYQIKSVR